MARALIIEDNASFRTMLRLALTQLGHEVIEARHGKEGLALQRKTSVDFVITDLLMPEMEGVETIMALKRCAPQLKIIAISGGGKVPAEDYLQIAAKVGATCTLAKPFSAKALAAAVATVLQPG
ncbi:MAG: hypothetical protein JWQ62_2423 [Lacunisphaera sp.]|nr:hypothetical protein [Lacunisphaera sp.]